jgi:flagellar FliL protein
MSDSDELDDIGGDEPDAGAAAPKKKGGLGNLLPTLLKFVAIGIGALVFIVTVSVITYNVMNRGGQNQTVIADPLSPYLGERPQYSYYDQIGTVTTRTKDTPVFSSVTVEMIIGYDLGDQPASLELVQRRWEIRDFIRRYFSGKFAAELAPERDEELKKDIREQLNTRFLDNARVRIILFNRLDVSSDAF